MHRTALMLEGTRSASFGDALAKALRKRSIEVDLARTMAQARAALAAADYACVVIDVGPNAPEGPALFDALLDRQTGWPLIVVGAGQGPRDRTAWIDRGADDALDTAADADELAARVAAVIRRGGARIRPRPLRHGPLVLEPEQRNVTWKGQAVSLTNKEFALLEILVRGAHQVHSRDALHTALCGEDRQRASNAVDVYVHALRRKLHTQLIRTLRGAGYRIADSSAFGDWRETARP